MLNLTGATRIFLRAGATDLRLGFAGLHALVESQLRQDVLSGHVYVFCNRTRTRIKVCVRPGASVMRNSESYASMSDVTVRSMQDGRS